MQLSAPTTPTDPSLAALFVAASRSLSNETMPGATGLVSTAGLPVAFADLLSDANAGAAPVPALCAAIAPDLGAAAACPAASATFANFPSWLTEDTATTETAAPGRDEIYLNPNAAQPSAPTPAASATRPVSFADIEGENADADLTPASSGTVGTVVAASKNARPAKSPKSPIEVRAAVRREPADSSESVAMPSVATPNMGLNVSGAGEPNVAAPAAEAEPEQALERGASQSQFRGAEAGPLVCGPGFGWNGSGPNSPKASKPSAEGGATNNSPHEETGMLTPELQADRENLPVVATPISARHDGKSFDSPHAAIPVAVVPASAATVETSDAAFPELREPNFVPTNAATRPEVARTFDSIAPRFSATPETPASPAALAAPDFDATPHFPIYRAPVVSSFTPPPAIQPVPELVRAVANEPAAPAPSAMAAPETPAGALPALAEPSIRAQSPDAAPRLIRFENSIPTREEIFAALAGNESSVKNVSATTPEKTFLSASPKRVATVSSDLGTDVAKPEPVMSTATLSHRPAFVAPLERAPEVTFAPASASFAESSTTEPAVVAHRAVDAVMTAVERFSVGDRHSVQMQFSVGGSDLSVRVELRGEEVRTTFRTDSPELRRALAHEWATSTPAVASDSSDRSVRIAAPVFSANNQSAFSAFSGDSGSRQHDARARRGEAEDIFSAVASRSRAAGFGSVIEQTAAPAARAAASGTALHLSTLA